jgi:8-oxo-dGTP pyrophosphatase MutT (NUDIX family)
MLNFNLSMPIQPFDLNNALSAYRGLPEEEVFVARCRALLQHPQAFERTHLPGHFTGSAWIVNPQRTHALLVHHGKLNRWMQPGGHADGDRDLFRVALKEAQEETGAVPMHTSPVIFDIDIHPIPARKDMPPHEHYDIRFLLVADDRLPVAVSEESHDVQWVALPTLEAGTRERSVLRLREKLLRSN